MIFYETLSRHAQSHTVTRILSESRPIFSPLQISVRCKLNQNIFGPISSFVYFFVILILIKHIKIKTN